MEKNELTHWGIKGMKWGVRRYQNKDGSLTELGKKRMYREIFDDEKKDLKDRKKYTAEPNRWVTEDTQNSKRLIDESGQMTSRLKTLNDKTMQNRPKVKMDLSNMTDKEMRDQINRALLERQYNDIFAPANVSKGQERVSQILDVAGATLGVASSALGIALAIKTLRGG